MNEPLFKRYTSTSALAGTDDNAVLSWSRGYFRKYYADLLPADKKNANILEIACGYGRYVKTMAEMGYTKCFGIDISDEQIDYARSKLLLKNIAKANALDWLNNRDSEYDCILAIDFLEHLSTDELLQLTSQCFTSLKQGGKMIIQVPNGMSPMNPVIHGDLTHIRAFTEQSMRQLLLYGGFSRIEAYPIPPYPYNVISTVRYVLWSAFLNPLLHCISLIAHGKAARGIYTENFIVVAHKTNTK